MQFGSTDNRPGWILHLILSVVQHSSNRMMMMIMWWVNTFRQLWACLSTEHRCDKHWVHLSSFSSSPAICRPRTRSRLWFPVVCPAWVQICPFPWTKLDKQDSYSDSLYSLWLSISFEGSGHWPNIQLIPQNACRKWTMLAINWIFFYNDLKILNSMYSLTL